MSTSIGNFSKKLKRKRKLAEPSIMEPSVVLDPLLEGLLAGSVSCNPQVDCPLFQIPGEIREQIFSYVVTEHDGKKAFARTDYWYRPGYTSRPYIETALLRTCRRVWLETFTLPVQHVTRRYWAGDFGRRPKELSYSARQAALALRYRGSENRKRILPLETIQVFIQMFALERNYDMLRILRDAEVELPTRHLIITIRYTDWWFWENNDPLRIDSRWIEHLQLPDTIEKLTMEFETRSGKQDELDAIIKRQVMSWAFQMHGGKKLEMALTSPKSSYYVGTDRPGGTTYVHHGAQFNPAPKGFSAPEDGEMYYYIVTAEFVAPPRESVC